MTQDLLTNSDLSEKDLLLQDYEDFQLVNFNTKALRRKKYQKRLKSKEREREKAILSGNIYKIIGRYEQVKKIPVQKKLKACYFYDSWDKETYEYLGQTDLAGVKEYRRIYGINNIQAFHIGEDTYICHFIDERKVLYILDEEEKVILRIPYEGDGSFLPLDAAYEINDTLRHRFEQEFELNLDKLLMTSQYKYREVTIDPKRVRKYRKLQKQSHWYNKVVPVSNIRVNNKQVLNQLKDVDPESDEGEGLLNQLEDKEKTVYYY